MEAVTLTASETTLLIVDDEPLMTELFRHFMTKRGFRVLTAAGGQEAIDIVAKENGAVRLVLTDMTMPGMDGIALAHQLLDTNPSMPTILATGHDIDPALVADLPNIIEIVRKPYQNKVLAERIREILG